MKSDEFNPTEIFKGDSWVLPRQQWIEIQAKGEEGDIGTFKIDNDLGFCLRAKGDLTEGTQVPIPFMSYYEYTIPIGKDGKMEISLAGQPFYPIPRTKIQIIQSGLKVKKKKRKKLTPQVKEIKGDKEREKTDFKE